MVLTEELAWEVARVMERLDLWDEMDLKAFVTTASEEGFVRYRFPVFQRTELILTDTLHLLSDVAALEAKEKRMPLTAQERARIESAQSQLESIRAKRWRREHAQEPPSAPLSPAQAEELLELVTATCGAVSYGAEALVAEATTKEQWAAGLSCANGLSLWLDSYLHVLCDNRQLDDEQKAQWRRLQTKAARLSDAWREQERLEALKSPPLRSSSLSQ